MVIVITLVFVSEGYRFSVLKSTMIWPIVQETVLNFVGSPYSMEARQHNISALFKQMSLQISG